MKELEIKIRKFLLRVFLLFARANKKPLIFPPEPKILVIRLNKLGDALITTPLLSLLNKSLNAKIYVLADKRNHQIFERNDFVEEVCIFEKGFAGFRKTLQWINSEKFHVLIDAHDDVSTTVSLISGFAKVPHKVSLEKENKKLFTQTIPKPDPGSTHIVERVAEIAKIFGIQFSRTDLRITYKPRSESLEKAGRFISANFPNKKYLLGINISAGSDARFWGIKNYRELIDSLKGYENIDLLILRAPADEKKAEEIANGVVPVFVDESFDEFAAIISKLDMLFSPDTSAVHLASVFGVPVFGLYVHFDTDEMIWKPYNTGFDCVITKESTLSGISYHQVNKQFKKFLEKNLNE